MTTERNVRYKRVKHVGHGVTFCDFSTFYAPTAGGIRTYHDAKLAWFSKQRRHRYVLVYPAEMFSVSYVSPSVTIVTVYGAPLRAGYRLPLDLVQVRRVVKELRPDVLETGDPWFSGPFGLWFKRLGYVRGLVASVFHGDPMRTYVDPWVARATHLLDLRRRLRNCADRWFFQVQGLYDLTLASSMMSEETLRQRGVQNVVRVRVGVDALFLKVGRSRVLGRCEGQPVRLLYVGRLQADKGVGLLLAAAPELLKRPDVTLTIVGRGPLGPEVARLQHPRLTYHDYISDRRALAAVYARHDVFLAPGPHETFGLAGLEALASGLTVVGPRAGGTGELLRQLESPCLFEAGDQASFLEAARLAIDGRSGGRVSDGRDLAETYGTWHDAIGREVDAYCDYLSRSTT